MKIGSCIVRVSEVLKVERKPYWEGRALFAHARSIEGIALSVIGIFLSGYVVRVSEVLKGRT